MLASRPKERMRKRISPGMDNCMYWKNFNPVESKVFFVKHICPIAIDRLDTVMCPFNSF